LILIIAAVSLTISRGPFESSCGLKFNIVDKIGHADLQADEHYIKLLNLAHCQQHQPGQYFGLSQVASHCGKSALLRRLLIGHYFSSNVLCVKLNLLVLLPVITFVTLFSCVINQTD
jgi:hypothetical protein